MDIETKSLATESHCLTTNERITESLLDFNFNYPSWMEWVKWMEGSEGYHERAYKFHLSIYGLEGVCLSACVSVCLWEKDDKLLMEQIDLDENFKTNSTPYK